MQLKETDATTVKNAITTFAELLLYGLLTTRSRYNDALLADAFRAAKRGR
jgi:hypothetical protein